MKRQEKINELHSRIIQLIQQEEDISQKSDSIIKIRSTKFTRRNEKIRRNYISYGNSTFNNRSKFNNY